MFQGLAVPSRHTMMAGEVLPDTGLYGEAPSERSTFFRLKNMKGQGFCSMSLSNEKVGKSVISSRKKAQKG